MKKVVAYITLIVFSISSIADEGLKPPPVLKPNVSPGLAALFSVIPGGGHVYLGDWVTAGGLLGTSLLGSGITAFQAARVCSLYRQETGDSCAEAGAGYFERYKFQEYAQKDPLRWLGPLGIAIASNTGAYSFYAAYRDARVMIDDEGFKYKMPKESLTDLLGAPFNAEVLKKPEVWGGILGSLAIGLTISFLAFPKNEAVNNAPSPGIGYPLMAIPVGTGEEALFRGFLQPVYTEWLGPEGGIAVSSALFGAAHIPNAYSLPPQDQWRYYAFVLPYLTLAGVYFGWLAHKNTSLKESVAVHTWYDFALFAMSAAAGASLMGSKGASITLPF